MPKFDLGKLDKLKNLQITTTGPAEEALAKQMETLNALADFAKTVSPSYDPLREQMETLNALNAKYTAALHPFDEMQRALEAVNPSHHLLGVQLEALRRMDDFDVYKNLPQNIVNQMPTMEKVLDPMLQARNSGFWGAATARDLLKSNLSIFNNFTDDTAKQIKIQSALSSLLESNIFDAKTYTSKSPANAAEGLNNLYNQVTAFANVVDLLSEDDPQKITTPVAVTHGAAWPEATHKYVDSQEQQAASVHQLLSLLQATALRVEKIEDKLEKTDDKVNKLPQKHSVLVFLLCSLLSCFSGIIFNVFANLVTEHIRANYPEIFPTPTIKKELPLELKSESFFAFGSLLPVERFGYNRVYVNLELLTGARYIVSIPQQYVTATAKTCTDVVARSFPRSRSRVVARLDVEQWVSVHQKKKKWALVCWIDPTSGTTRAGWVPKRQIKKATPQRKTGLA